MGADYGSWQWELISDIIGGIVTLGSHTVAVAMPGSLARVQPNKVKLSKNGPHVRAMDLGPKRIPNRVPHGFTARSWFCV